MINVYPKYTKKQIKKALIKGNFKTSIAAKILGCVPQTIVRYLNMYEDLREDVLFAREALLDLTENKLVEKIDEGNLKAICFFLEHQGQSRGYVKKQEHIMMDERKIDDAIKVELEKLQGGGQTVISTEAKREGTDGEVIDLQRRPCKLLPKRIK